MVQKLAIIHTTPLTVETLKSLAAELLPDCQVINFVDDSILPELAENGGQLDAVKERLNAYAQFAMQQGADVILNACSSVGGLVKEMQLNISTPIVRIDQAMAERAVCSGNKIGVAATLNTTLGPTMKLLQETAEKLGVQVELTPVLCDSAYRKLLENDKGGHDEELMAALSELIEKTDVIVLAQASMARVADRLPEEDRSRVLSSPRLGMEKVKQTLSSIEVKNVEK